LLGVHAPNNVMTAKVRASSFLFIAKSTQFRYQLK